MGRAATSVRAAASRSSPRRRERVAVGGRDADRRRAADASVADRVRDLRRRAALELDLLVGKPPLVEEDDAVRLEPDDLLGREP